jgi:hypothetical protein
MGQSSLASSERTVGLDLPPPYREVSKLDCYARFDKVAYWLARTRDLIASSDTYAYAAFRESFRELRRESRASEIELVITLFRFEREMRRHAADADKD